MEFQSAKHRQNLPIATNGLTMEKLLNKHEIAAMLGTSPGVAASILAESGIIPIDFGVGKGRGFRWLLSAVQSVLLQMHEEAQAPQQKIHMAKPKRQDAPPARLAGMTPSELFALTTRHHVQ